MNSLSSQPFLMMCHMIPYNTGMTVPGRMRTYSVACAAVRVMRVFEAVDALADEFLVFPAVLDDVPHDPVQHRDDGAGPDAHVFGGMRGGAGHARLRSRRRAGG